MTIFLATKLEKIFRGLIAAGSFPVRWRTAKGSSPSQFHLDYRPIFITAIISNVYKNLFLEGFISLLIHKSFAQYSVWLQKRL